MHETSIPNLIIQELNKIDADQKLSNSKTADNLNVVQFL
jgi:hypothetical protein